MILRGFYLGVVQHRVFESAHLAQHEGSVVVSLGERRREREEGGRERGEGERRGERREGTRDGGREKRRMREGRGKVGKE